MAFVDPYADLVHFALLQRVTATDFAQVIYDEQGCMEFKDPVQCESLFARPTGSSWDTPAKHRLTDRLERQTWPWELVLKFNTAVSLEEFEASMAEDPPVVARDATHDRQLTLRLSSASYFHPPQNQPSAGTEVVYGINVEQTPV